MAGLLDFIKTPEGQGLLSAAFGGIAGARRGTPWNNVGRAGMAGLLGYGNAVDQQTEQAQLAKRNEMFDLQLAQARQEQETADGIRRAGAESMRTPAQMTLMNGQGPTVANAAAIENTQPGFDTQGFLSRVMAIDPLKGMSLQQGMAKDTPFGKVDPKDYTPESVAKFAQTRNFGDLQPVREMKIAPNGQVYNPLQIQPDQVFADPNQPFTVGPGGVPVPNLPFQSFALNKAERGAARNNIDARTINTQESEQSKAYGKTLGEIRSNITAAAFKAPGKLAKLSRIEELLGGIGTGTTTALQAAQLADSVGLKLDPNLGVKEAAESITRELAGELREPGTGTSTDFDFQNWLQQVPGLTKSPEGRAEIIKTYRAKAARDIEVGKLAREYAKRNNGVIDDGFMDVVSDYVAKNPVVSRVSTSGRKDAFPGMDAIEAELARRKGQR